MKRFAAVASAVSTLLLVVAAPAASPEARRTPKLVVILVVDQMRADYVEKFGEHWTGGLRRLMDDGAWFRLAAYPYLTTVTCVGHSTIVTGSLPATHGIVSNTWWDRDGARTLGCVADAEATLVSYGAPAKGGTSTRHLMVPAFPDELRLQAAVPPRIVTASMKDYTATMLAGRRADAAVWFNPTAHALTTSSVFAAAPVPFVASFVAAHPIEAYFDKTWNRILPEADYLYEDEGAGERASGSGTRTFPHVLRGAGAKPDAEFYAAWERSPFSDAYLGQFAEVAIDALKLGQGAGVDYLAVSFSALDLVGHDFGPRSHEVQDVLAQLDRTVGSLLAHLDRSVGRQNYVLALTSDHGVAPIAVQATALGLSGGGVSTAEIVARVEKALEPSLGAGKKVARMLYSDLYFEPGVFEKLQANPAAMRAAIDAVRGAPGVWRVFRSDDLAHPFASAEDPIERAALTNFFPGRSGDLVVVTRPYWVFGSGADGTTHGSAQKYDQRVPLFLLGQGIRKGQFLGAGGPVDIAPTLAFLCGMTLGAAEGRVLDEALLPLPAPGSAPAGREKRP